MTAKYSLTNPSPLLLEPRVQHYAWGKVGSLSLVAQLLQNCAPNVPYAELWFGSHPKATALAVFEGEEVTLERLIASFPREILGDAVFEKYGATLPFLFKVLSVGSALSIQAHPDITLAQELHRKNPEQYPDDNHKPEIAIALSPMTLLYGFKPFAEIAQVLSSTPELSSLLGSELVAEFLGSNATNERIHLSRIYGALVNCPREQLEEYGVMLLERLSAQATVTEHEQLILSLAKVYGAADIGLLSSYLMNWCTLQVGEGVFVGPNIPHAYISGDLIECMANSDNVVRAGFTPKFQDRETLVSMVTYEMGRFAPLVPHKDERGCGGNIYPTPAQEFAISELGSASSGEFAGNGGPVLLFCLEGGLEVSAGTAAVALKRGGAALIPACIEKYSLKIDRAARAFRVIVPGAVGE